MKVAVSFMLALSMLTNAAAAGTKTTTDAAPAGVESAKPAGDVVLVLNEGFLNALLEAVLEQPNPPKFPLSKSGGGGSCPSEIMLSREEQGTRTAIRFKEGRVTAPVAFRGSYSAPLLGCFRFEGWADTVFNLAFDPSRQAFTARVEVKNVSLNKIPALLGGSITQLVQDAIDERVNPVEILRAEQLAARLPVTRESVLRLRAREIQHQIVGTELRVRILYEIVRGQ